MTYIYYCAKEIKRLRDLVGDEDDEEDEELEK